MERKEAIRRTDGMTVGKADEVVVEDKDSEGTDK